MRAQALSVMALLRGAGRSVIEHRADLVRLFWFPALLAAAADVMQHQASVAGGFPGLAGLAATALAAASLVPAATAWHRRVLLGSVDGRARYTVGRRELRYGAYALIYCAVILVVGMVLWAVAFAFSAWLAARGQSLSAAEAAVLGTGFALIGMAVALLATTRIFLIFPGAALGDAVGFRGSAAALRGNRLRLFAASFAPMLPSLLLQVAIMPAGDTLAGSVAAAVAHSLVGIPLMAVSVSVLSLAYATLCRGKPVDKSVGHSATREYA
jgi:hypothetical protein